MLDSIGRLILHLPVFLMFVTVTLAVAKQNCSDCSIKTQSGRRLRCIIPGPTEYECGMDTPFSPHTSAPRNLKAKPTTGSDSDALHPSFEVSWSPPNLRPITNLIGFEIRFIPDSHDAPKICRKLELKDKLQPSDGEVVFRYPAPGCFVEKLQSNTEYMIKVITLPSDNTYHSRISITRKTKNSTMIAPYRWNTNILINSPKFKTPAAGEVVVWFAEAPEKFVFTQYEIMLDTGKIDVIRVENNRPWNIHIFPGLCQGNYTVYITPVNTKNTKGKHVCVDLYGEEHSSGCMTTFKKFTITDGDPSCATKSTSPPPPPPFTEIISGTSVGGVLIIVVTTVTIITIVKRRRKRGLNPPHAPYLIAGGYGATGVTQEVCGPAANQGARIGDENPGFQQSDEDYDICSEESDISSHKEEQLVNDRGEIYREDWAKIDIRIP